ncbi:MAG: hypothetical protein K2N56_02415 [Oscillospiraceae bacterium]|nr:hypothetical protein [Oscillospiraceae bacterium]
MVYTLTFCPSLEYSAALEDVEVGADNIVSNGDLHVSGSGAIIAKVLNELSVQSTVLGFAAGFIGGEIEEILRRRGINTDIVYLESGLSPLNVVFNHGANGEKRTRFAAPQLDISNNDLMALFARLENLSDGDVLVLSGEVPPCIPADIYSHIPDAFAGKNVQIILDVPSEPLAKCLQFQPFLVVTDSKRLAEIFGEPPETEEQILAYINQIQDLGAQNVLAFSDIDNTVILLDGNKSVLKQTAQAVPFGETALNAMTAGFIAGSEDNDVDNEYALMLAAAAQRAAAAEKGVPPRAAIISIMKDLMKNHS